MEEKIIRAKVKGYNVLKGALDGDLETKTIIRTKHTITDEDLGKIIDEYDYYIYEKDNMFHRCNSEGKLGAKYQDRFLNYNVLEKDFEFYKTLEEEKEIPEKINVKNYDKCIHDVTHKEKEFSLDIRELQIRYNDLIDYLKSKGE